MRPLRRQLVRLLLIIAASGCASRADETVPAHGPEADFLLTAGDSTFWVRQSAGGLAMRGAPIDLVMVDSEFHELYVVDEAIAWDNAVFVAERVYRRNVLTNDSVLVYRDAVIPALAREYAAAHPGEPRLADDADPPEDPDVQATSSIDFDAVHGAYVSFTLHTDVDRADAPLWHATRRGVIDVRSARLATLADVAGSATASVLARRAQVLQVAVDSVRTGGGRRALAMLAHYRREPASFALTTVNGAPAVSFALEGEGVGEAGRVLALEPIAIGDPSWWRMASSSLPVTSASGDREVWRHTAYDVVARYRADGDQDIVVRDSTSREWLVGRVSPPAERLYWLDRISRSRHEALERAFEDAASYGEDGRVALARQLRTHTLLLASGH